MNPPMYRNSTEQEDYIDTWRGGGSGRFTI